MAVYDDVKRAFQDILAPQMAELKGDMNARFAQVETRITELRAEMDTRFSDLKSEMNSRFAAADSQMGQFRAEFRQEVNNIHTDLVRIEQVFDARLQTVGIVERVARIEERLARA